MTDSAPDCAERLAPEHREFPLALTVDLDGHPPSRGRHADVGGSYRLDAD